MKKILCTSMLLVGLGLTSKAQFIYNKTYYNSYSPSFVKPMDLVNAFVDGNSVMLSREEYGTGPEKEIILTKFNDQGNILYERLWNIVGSGVTIRPDKLVFTNDNGFIVVGRIFRSGNSNPFAAKFTYTGDHTATEWAKEYPENVGAWDQGRNPKVNITKIKDGTTEDYIIVTNGKPTEPATVMAYPQDASILALRIQGANGNVVWNNKYEIPFAVRSTLTYNMLNNRPYALANGDGKSLIAGELDYGIPNALGYKGFYLAVNDNGTINQGYNIMEQWSCSNHNAIWDDRADGSVPPPASAFVMSYAAASNMAGPTASRVVAVQKFSSVGTVTPTSLSYYTDGGDEIYPIGIDNKRWDDAYTISCWSRLSESAGVGQMSMLAIDKVGVPPLPINYSRFNTSTPTDLYYMTPIVSLLDQPLLQERNVMLGHTAKPSGPNGIRMISADPNLEACGFNHLPVMSADVPPSFTPLPYIAVTVPVTPTDLNFTEGRISSTSDDCKFDPSPDTYRLTSVGSTGGSSSLKVYPTLLKDGQREIKLDVNAMNKSNLEVSLISIDGKYIARNKFQLVEGNQTLIFKVPELITGSYMISVHSVDGKINQRINISKL
jgi:hypothetical protein